MPEADQAAAGCWDTHGSGTTPAAVDALDAMRCYGAAEQAMRRRTRASMGMGETDLGAVHYLLEAQRADRVVTAKDLARHLEISSASTTALIDRLARSGHVRRNPHPSDRRAVVVVATPDSHREVGAALDRVRRAMLEVAASFGPEELGTIRAFLERLRGVVEEA